MEGVESKRMSSLQPYSDGMFLKSIQNSVEYFNYFLLYKANGLFINKVFYVL